MLGLFGCWQMLELVGIGTQLVLEGLELEVVVGFAGADVDAAGHVYTEVEIVADGGDGDGPLGGYLDVQPDLWQFPPGHQFPQ